MKTFLKLVLIALAALVVAHFCPLALLPLAGLGLAMMVIGGVLSSGLAAVLTVAVTLVTVILAVLVALLAATSPLWIPVLLILGLLSLFRRPPAKAA